MSNPNLARLRFTPQQKQEAVAHCLGEGLTCTAVAQRLVIPVSSLAKWVRHPHIDRGELSGSRQGPLTSEERAELMQPRNENRELRREKFCLGRLQRTLPRISCRREVAPDRSALRPAHHCLALLRVGCDPQRYYPWNRRQQSPLGRPQVENAAIIAEIQAMLQEHRGFYGSPWIHKELRATGRSIGRHRVARLMQRAGLRAKTRWALRPCSKASGATRVV